MPKPVQDAVPHNPEAERCVLNSILANNDNLAVALRHVNSGEFFVDQHQMIFRAMLAMNEAAQSIELWSLVEWLQAKGQLEQAGGAAYLSSLIDPLYMVSDVEQHARIVHRKASQRELAKAAERLSQKALQSEANLAAVQAELRTLVAQPLEEMKIIGGNGHLFYDGLAFLEALFPEPEHLIERVIPKCSTVMVFALPHSLKSWFTLGLAIQSTRAGLALGKLVVKKPVRTLVIQVEDFPGQVQWRMRQLLRSDTFKEWDADNFSMMPRCGLNLPNENWYQVLLRKVESWRADHVIFDVLRRIYRGSINDPEETAAFVEVMDRLREAAGCTTTLVHHENRKQAEIMLASAGSYQLPGWANVMIQFKRKTEHGGITSAEMEVDNKLAASPEAMTLVLEADPEHPGFLSPSDPLRLEALEDGMGVAEARERLGSEWSARDLAEVSNFDRATAYRRLKKWESANLVERLATGKSGPHGGQARYRFVGSE